MNKMTNRLLSRFNERITERSQKFVNSSEFSSDEYIVYD